MRIAKNFRLLALLMLLGAAPVFAFQQAPAPAAQAPAQAGAPAGAAAPETKPKPKTADENPFPEELSRKAAQGDDAGADKPPTSAAKQGDSDASSSRSKFQGLGDMTDDGDRISDGAGGVILNPKLATEDVKVGGFYLDQHDYVGAYKRFKEATLVNPEDADAVFGLAEAARGLNHRDEALLNYRIYLDSSPEGKKAKAARKALDALIAAPVPAPGK